MAWHTVNVQKCLINEWILTEYLNPLALDINVFWIIGILKSYKEIVKKTALLSSFLATSYVSAHKKFCMCVWRKAAQTFHNLLLFSCWDRLIVKHVHFLVLWILSAPGCQLHPGRSPEISLEQPVSASHKICSWNGSFFYSGNTQLRLN